MRSFDQTLFWTYRLTKIALDTVACLVLLLFVIPRGETSLTRAGQHTMYAYVLHSCGIWWYIALHKMLQNHDALPLWTSSALGSMAVAFLQLGISAVFLFLFT